MLQSLTIDFEIIVLFWTIFWRKNFVCMNCETNLTSECAPKSPWLTGFEESKIHQPNPEKFQFKGSKIGAFFHVFLHFPLKSSKNAQFLLPLNCYFSGLGWWILDFSKPLGRGGFGAHSEANLVSQFMQTKFLGHKMSQNSTIISKSIVRNCTCRSFGRISLCP